MPFIWRLPVPSGLSKDHRLISSGDGVIKWKSFQYTSCSQVNSVFRDFSFYNPCSLQFHVWSFFTTYGDVILKVLQTSHPSTTNQNKYKQNLSPILWRISQPAKPQRSNEARAIKHQVGSMRENSSIFQSIACWYQIMWEAEVNQDISDLRPVSWWRTRALSQ